MLLVNIRENREVVRRAAAARGYTARIVLDEEGKVADAYRVTGTPTAYVLDQRREIIGRAIGRRDWAGHEARRLFATLLSTPIGSWRAPGVTPVQRPPDG